VKPLLNVSRTDDELRKREEAIKSLEEQAKAISNEKDRLE
jgi:hypothetical protein